MSQVRDLLGAVHAGRRRPKPVQARYVYKGNAGSERTSSRANPRRARRVAVPRVITPSHYSQPKVRPKAHISVPRVLGAYKQPVTRGLSPQATSKSTKRLDPNTGAATLQAGALNFPPVDPYAGQKTIDYNADAPGGEVTVNATAAPRFEALLKALSAQGYPIESLGGFNERNIAGTNRKSLHSYGLAIDINPGANPVTYGGRGAVRTNMPKGVGEMARQYGLEWGGNWNGSKQDPMHFSYPMFGTK